MSGLFCRDGGRFFFSAKIFFLNLQSVLLSANLNNGNEVISHSKLILAAISNTECSGANTISHELARRIILLIGTYCSASLSRTELSDAARHVHEYLSQLIAELDVHSPNADSLEPDGSVSASSANKKKARRALLIKHDLASLRSDPQPAA